MGRYIDDAEAGVQEGLWNAACRGYHHRAAGICTGTATDFSIADLKSSYPTLLQEVFTSSLLWDIHVGVATGALTTGTGSPDDCAAVCQSVAGCRFFSVSSVTHRKACLLHKSCANLASAGCWSRRLEGKYISEQHNSTSECYDFATAQYKCVQARK